MPDITAMSQLQNLVLTGFRNWEEYGDVKAIYQNGLILFNYTAAAQFSGRWNWFETVSRGLIINQMTGEVVARPFDKFWNWMEGGRFSTGHIVSVTEKLDGSLGILYRYDGVYKVATRGSFDGEQALWATAHLKRYLSYFDHIPQEYTLLFEIIYPENRIVVDYGGKEALYLLAVRNRFTGDYLPFYPDTYEIATHHGFQTPQTYIANNITQILGWAGTISASEEGWVIEFSDGLRFKIKGDRYKEIHRLVTDTTFKRVLETVSNNTFDKMIGHIPDEFLEQILQWREDIENKVYDISMRAKVCFALAPRRDRKEFALWVQRYHADLSPYMFLLYDGKDIRQTILSREFGRGSSANSSEEL